MEGQFHGTILQSLMDKLDRESYPPSPPRAISKVALDHTSTQPVPVLTEADSEKQQMLPNTHASVAGMRYCIFTNIDAVPVK